MLEEDSKEAESKQEEACNQTNPIHAINDDQSIVSLSTSARPKSTSTSMRKLSVAFDVVPKTLKPLADPQFYQQPNFLESLCEVLFKLKRRGATVQGEIYYGLVHYISCLYVLAVVPQQLQSAGYNSQHTVVAVALVTGAATIFCGLFANLPFVLAPPTVVSIFLSGSLQQNSLTPNTGSMAVVFSGTLLLIFGWRPIGKLAARLVPQSIQIGTAVGIGLLTALAGSTEIDLIVSGTDTIVQIGYITPEIIIAFAGVTIISVGMFYHVKGSFAVAVIFCSIVWWSYDNSFPRAIASLPQISLIQFTKWSSGNDNFLVVDLIFLYVLYLNGLMSSLSNLAVLTREDSTIPRGRWVFIMCGIFTIISGCCSSAPILVSPESSAAIKAGAKTGLSAVVCGVLFLLSTFFAPLFQATPSAGTSPVLIMIGIILYQNNARVDWRDITVAAPAFVVLFYIPFTYSVIQGVIIGYNIYILVNLLTGELPFYMADFLLIYFPSLESCLIPLLDRIRRFQVGHEAHDQQQQHGREAPRAIVEGSEALRRSFKFDIRMTANERNSDRNTHISQNLDDDGGELALRFSIGREPISKRFSAANQSGILDFNTDFMQFRGTIARPRTSSINNTM